MPSETIRGGVSKQTSYISSPLDDAFTILSMLNNVSLAFILLTQCQIPTTRRERNEIRNIMAIDIKSKIKEAYKCQSMFLLSHLGVGMKEFAATTSPFQM